MKHSFTFCLLAAPTLLAQAQTAGQIAGHLRDAYQPPLPFTMGLLQPLPDTLAERAVQVGADGRYLLAGAQPGRYWLVAMQLGTGASTQPRLS